MPLALAMSGPAAQARAAVTPADASRMIPPRALPVPATVSPQLQAHIAAPYPPGWDAIPSDAAGWKDLQARSAQDVAPYLPSIVERLGVTIEPGRIAGVNVFHVTPADVAPENRNRLLLHVHGGGYVLYPGEAGAGEAMMMAGYGRIRCVSVDYRMPPDFPFPAAIDDVTSVWTELAGRHGAARMGVLGTSAGGALVLSLVQRARRTGLPLPAAVSAGTPWADLAGQGDTIAAHAYVDNVLVSETGWLGAAASLYAGTTDPKDPLVSPINGDFRGFPPTILTSGTRDLLLSDTVRVHRALRRAGVEALLQVFEGQSHAQFLAPFVPETEEALREIALFFGRYLAT